MGNSCPCRRCEKVPRKTVTLFMGGGDSNRIFAHHNYSIGSQPPAQTFPPCFVTAPQPGALDWEFCKSLETACPTWSQLIIRHLAPRGLFAPEWRWKMAFAAIDSPGRKTARLRARCR